MDGTKMKWDTPHRHTIAGVVLNVSFHGGKYLGGAWLKGTNTTLRQGCFRPSEARARTDAERLAKELVEDVCMAVLDMARAFDVDLADFGRMAEQWTGPR